MTAPTRQADRFTSQPGLFDLAPAPLPAPSPEKVRARLLEWLATARSAERMPWDVQDARKYTILFHQMANWLPDEERERLRAEFSQHMDRLRAAG